MVDADDAKLVQDLLIAYPEDSFVSSVAEGLKKYGKLTEKQRAAMEKKQDEIELNPKAQENIQRSLDDGIDPNDIPDDL